MEEQYYLVWPLVLLICPVAWYIPVAVALIAVNVAIASGITGLQPLGAGPLSFHMPASTYAPLVIGSLAAIILDRRRGFEVLDQLCKNHLTPLVGFAALAVLIETMPADLRGLPNLLIHSTMAFILVSLVVREQNVLTGVLASPIIARVGVVSYGIYLYHLIALHLIHGVIDPQQTVAVFVLYSALAYIIAEISFRTLEAWFRRFRPVTRRAIA
jgi:peptidoglycan/LPS O-acetylase OafA/YrhL